MRKSMRILLVASVVVFLSSAAFLYYPPLSNNTTTVFAEAENPDYVDGELVMYNEMSDEQRQIVDEAIANGSSEVKEGSLQYSEHLVIIKDGEAYSVEVEKHDSAAEKWAFVGVLLGGCVTSFFAVVGLIQGLKRARYKSRLR